MAYRPLLRDLKDIDRLDVGVVEHRGGQAAAVHERGVEVDAVRPHVWLLDRRVAVNDIFFVRPPVSEERAANPQPVGVRLVLQRDAGTDARVNVVAEFVLERRRQTGEPPRVVAQSFEVRIALDGRAAAVVATHPVLLRATVAAQRRLGHHGLVIALQGDHGREDRVFGGEAPAEQLDHAERVGPAIDIVAERDQPRGFAAGMRAAQVEQPAELAATAVNVADDIGASHGCAAPLDPR